MAQFLTQIAAQDSLQINTLRPEFDALVARIRTPQAKQAGNFLFTATGLQLGAFAQARALADARRKRE
jgi:hypothetical protein